jgi:lipopolysaccharide/colanic/teichoic acid biosynthesis glycosyltransferase
VVSSIMLLLASPLIVLTMLLIKLDSKGPVFFKQDRVGRDGKVFTLWKFRSMCADAEKETGPIWSEPGDKRVTRVGKFLRRTRIDEIPQFWNVIRGDMSVIGPRPERPEFAQEFVEKVPGYAQRLKVRPGITGLAQVYCDYLTSVYHKLRYDWIYINRMSFWQEARHYFPRQPAEGGWVVLRDPEGRSPNISLNRVQEKPTGRNRLHLDLYTDDREGEVARLLRIGATRHPQTYEPDEDFRVLVDPDGNLFCVVQIKCATCR